jgi:superoxide reductase
MNDRRNFMKAGLVVTASAVGLSACNTIGAKEETVKKSVDVFPGGMIYTRENPGMWKKKIGGHAPEVTVADGKVKIETHHGMSPKHYIVRHTIVSPSGEVLGAKTFSSSDDEAVSEFDVPAGESELYATSFCNKHDLWVTKFTV